MIAGILAFLASSVGRWIGAGLVLMAIYGAGYGRGYLRAFGACDAAALRSDLASVRQQLAITQSAALAAERSAAALATEDAANAAQIETYRAELAKRPNAACALTGDDVRRLRSIK